MVIIQEPFVIKSQYPKLQTKKTDCSSLAISQTSFVNNIFESYFLFTSNDVGLAKNLKLQKCFYSSVYIMAFTKMPLYAMRPFSWPSFHLLLKTIFTQQNIHTQCTTHLHISQGFCIPFFMSFLCWVHRTCTGKYYIHFLFQQQFQVHPQLRILLSHNLILGFRYHSRFTANSSQGQKTNKLP